MKAHQLQEIMPEIETALDVHFCYCFSMKYGNGPFS